MQNKEGDLGQKTMTWSSQRGVSGAKFTKGQKIHLFAPRTRQALSARHDKFRVDTDYVVAHAKILRPGKSPHREVRVLG